MPAGMVQTIALIKRPLLRENILSSLAGVTGSDDQANQQITPPAPEQLYDRGQIAKKTARFRFGIFGDRV